MAGPNARPRIDVLGVGVSNTNPTDAVEQVCAWIDAGERAYVCVVPVSGIMAAQRDPAVHRAIEGAGLAVPDGMPVVWAGKHAGAEGMERVYGPDLMELVNVQAAKNGWKVFLYGGSEEANMRLADALRSRFPQLEVAGRYAPPFRELTVSEADEVAARINESGASIVWVGLSTPKQDLWMADMIERLQAPVVLLGVGAAFDIHAGLKKRPPDWLGPLGLFWLYRLLQEPRRLWRRYLADVPSFLVRIALRRPFLRDARA